MKLHGQRRRRSSRHFETLESRQLLYAVNVLADVNQQDSSNPRDFVEFGDQLLFVANHKDYGAELFVTDGTTAGTQLLKDIYPGRSGSFPSNFVVSGDYLYFAATEFGSSKQLWRTDGTPAGTIEVDEWVAGRGNTFTEIGEAVDVDGTLFFVGAYGTDRGLYKTRGDQDGIDRITSFSDTGLKGAQQLIALDDRLYFIGTHNTSGKELWTVSTANGSAALVKDVVVGAQGVGAQLVRFGDSLYFFATTDSPGLWKSDGTAAGTSRVATIPDAAAAQLTAADDAMYFVSGTVQSQSKLWSSDGTEAGTGIVYEPAAPASLYNLRSFGPAVVFNHWADGDSRLHSYRPGSGTVALHTLPVYSSFAAAPGTTFEDEYYYRVETSWGPSSLWKTDGTPQGTALVIENAGSGLAAALGSLFVTAGPTYQGLELWRFDDAGSEPELVVDLPADGTEHSAPRDFLMVGSQVFFTADGGQGRGLWVSDGTVGNATRLADLARLDSSKVIGSQLYFVATDYQGRTFLGVTDGTVVGTSRIEFEFLENPFVAGLAELNGELLVTVFDGSRTTTLCRISGGVVHLIAQVEDDFPWGLDKAAVLGGNLYFIWPGPEQVSMPNYVTRAVWVTDGTTEGTYSLYDQFPVWPGDASNLIAFEDKLFFAAGGIRDNLYRTDGTADGTVQIPGVVDPADFTLSGGYLYFTQRGLTSFYRDLMRIDTQSTAATLVVADAGVPDYTQGATYLADLNGELYFAGEPDWAPRGLYKVVEPGAYSLIRSLVFFGSDLIAVDGVLYINQGFRMIRSDGTPDGTFALGIPYDVLNSPLRSNLVGHDGRIYFTFGDSEPYFASSRSEVTGRNLFYSGSSFDTNGAELGAGDNAAIATDKTAYLPGAGAATFANISSYVHGITGVMIDFNFLTANLSLEDFQFRVGTTNNLEAWAPAPQPVGFRSETAYPGYFGLPTRVTLSWAEGAIKNTWLEVTVLANERTGLTEPEVFYFGSRVGDTGSGSALAAITSAADELAARNNPGVNVPISSLLDFDRDGIVGAADALIARNHGGVLLKLNLPAPAASRLAAAPLATTDEKSASLDVIAEPVAASRAAESVLRGDLLAFALQRWSDLLDDDADEEDDAIAGLFATRGRR